MNWKVLHRSERSLRVRCEAGRLSFDQADGIEYYLDRLPEVTGVKVYDRTGDAIIKFRRPEDLGKITRALAAFAFEDPDLQEAVQERGSGRALDRQYQDQIVFSIFRRYAAKFFLPIRLRLQEYASSGR